MFDHRAILCSIRVINSRCDILLDRSVDSCHSWLFEVWPWHNKLQYTVFCLLTVYLVVSSFTALTTAFLIRVSLAKCVFFVMYCFMQSVYCLNSLSTRLSIVVVVHQHPLDGSIAQCPRNEFQKWLSTQTGLPRL